MRVLVIEDEPRMLESLRRGLHEHDFAVMTATDGVAGLDIATEVDFDAVVLDVGLPGRDGFALARELRSRKHRVPVLMLTARDAEDDIIHGLEQGADDYMTKPFSFPELVARLRSITRPAQAAPAEKLQCGDLILDLVQRTAMRGDRAIELTRTEYLLLSSLLQHAGRCVTRQALVRAVWGAEPTVSTGALDVLVNALRAKVDGEHEEKLIATVRGSGYCLLSPLAVQGRAS